MMGQPTRIFRALALAGAFATVSGLGAMPPHLPTERAVRAEPRAGPIDVGPEIATFYRERGFAPLWAARAGLRPEAHQLLLRLAEQGSVAPELARAAGQAQGGDRHALARADLMLSRAFADWSAELHRPPARSTLRYIDRGLAPEPRPARARLDDLAAAPSLAEGLARAQRVNPALDGLRRGLADYRARWARLPQVEVRGGPEERARRLRRRLGLAAGSPDAALAARLRAFQAAHALAPSGTADRATVAALNGGAPHYERLILANIERARAIPARPGGRYILVDTASARLWMVEDGRLAGVMRVIVGKAAMPTPAMAGLVRYAVLNPYWIVPPDLIRERARKVLRRGPRTLAAERLQILSNWSAGARPLSPRQVDWRAVAAGRAFVNLRQRPGPENMMGRIKFMMPNDLGVYLHDTPLREYFARADRRISSGCVRLEDAPRLARWLFRGRAPRPSGAAEQRVDLPEPVPVYITYLTALPSRGGVQFVPDRYDRDRALLAQMPGRPSPLAGCAGEPCPARLSPVRGTWRPAHGQLRSSKVRERGTS